MVDGPSEFSVGARISTEFSSKPVRSIGQVYIPTLDAAQTSYGAE